MRRSEVWLVCLDPAVGSEIRKTRPAVIVSPDVLNEHLCTVVVVPLATGRSYPFRIPTRVQGTDGVAAVDQIRTLDKRRLVKQIGTLDADTTAALLDALAEMFAP